MAEQNTHQSRRQHFHRGRRGPDRRGPERRSTPHTPDPANREHVDVEQIMRDIRARISQRHGVELSNQQIQELAARRLEAVLDARNIKPALLEQLRKNAGETADIPEPASDAGYAFEDTTLYETHRGFLRFIRRLLNPILKLLFNPTPLIHALNTQARLNKEAAARETERDRRQAEWNALHYELLQRMVAEVSRVSIEVQAASMRMESLAAKVDFNERRVRGMESAAYQGRPPQRPAPPEPAAVPPPPRSSDTVTTEAPATEGGEGPRRRRRRRRGRRGGAGPADAQPGMDAAMATAESDEGELVDAGEGPDEEPAEPVTADEENAVALEPAHAMSPLQPLEPRSLPTEAVQPEAPRNAVVQPEARREEPPPAAPADGADEPPPDR